MAPTALNEPNPLKGQQLLNVIAVMAAIAVSLLLLTGVTYLMYRNTPETGTPNRLDQAEGVTPQDPPATPAVPESHPASHP